MSLIPWYYKAGAGLLILGAYTAFIWHLGGQSERLDAAKKENAALTQAIADNAKANDERRAAQKEVDRLATLPPKVIERVRQNPSGCSLNPVVADELRRQVDEINRAIREQNR